MKKIILVFICLIGSFANAQTSKELIGNWQLVKWVKNGAEKDIVSYYKTDQVFQFFQEDHKFNSVIGDAVHKGKWKLSDDNTELTIDSKIVEAKFKIEYFDMQRRVISNPELGTFEYKRVVE
ncbi:DUF5004 domain-containing protein [Flavobacterium sp.]|uniref:DUF5004 domain-containing protein n=1 Tax=Flavobacterium sp. TaxID=239 RepID=UPI003D6A9E46